MGCEDFVSFSEEEERRAGHFGSSPLIRRGHMTHLPLKKQFVTASSCSAHPVGRSGWEVM